MEDNNISAPLPQAEGETQSPPAPAETTAVKVEVTVTGAVENLHANGGGDGGGEEAEDGGDGESGGVVGPEVTIRRKRGRSRKHHQLGSPNSSASPASLGPKRGRGRPPGSGKLQMLASLGELGDTAGGNFTPYALAIQTGVDIAGVLSSFAQKGAPSFCILSAVGCVSIVDICPAGYFGSGSYTCTATGNVQREIGRLSVSLANPDGSVFGGTVVGSLVAAMPIQLILGSFKQNIKLQLLRRHSAEPSTAMDSPSVSVRVQIPTPTVKSENVEENSVATPNGDENTISDHNLTHAFLQNSDQNGSQPSDPASDEKALT
ncbi:hypothetical protein RHGRI_036679 [Rhododendron griersonianum]|uniref:AT-hook motif nuclear-localized protein n=1 Tax=Rhododendron griersonianum TaxID=479676 RepID=A0AAV6HNZ8_9ERIC|nr:hypothetical protein RHGRI_036679 [Rhododendron griersonianum]